MKWCDCSHCIRHRTWSVWVRLMWAGFALVGIVQLMNADWFFGVAIVVVNAGLLFLLAKWPNPIPENQTCKVELAAAMLKGEDDEGQWPWLAGRPSHRYPPQPPPTSTPTAGRKFLQ